jgi:hypothetical protein
MRWLCGGQRKFNPNGGEAIAKLSNHCGDSILIE